MTQISEEHDMLVVKNGDNWTYVHSEYTVDFAFKDRDTGDVQIAVHDSDNKLTAMLWIENSAAKKLTEYCEENNIDNGAIY